MKHQRPTLLAACSSALLVLLVTSTAHAQAWVADPGDLDVGVDYSLGRSTKIVSGEMDFDNAGTLSQELELNAEYAPISRLAISASLPLVMLQYTGDKSIYPHAGGGSYDDGDMHTTLTDLRAGARYQVIDSTVAIAPHVAVSIPVADYETVGNTVAGRHLKQLHIGASAGLLFGLASYVHFTYEFSLAEKYDRTADTAKYSQNHSDLAFTIGHKLLDYRLDLHAGLNMRRTHGGVSLDDLAMLTPDEALYHDAILDEDILLAGAGVGYQLSNTLSATAELRLFVAGQNTQNASVFAVGLSWTPLSRRGAE